MWSWIPAIVAGLCFGLAPLHGMLGPPVWFIGLWALGLSVRGHVTSDLARGMLVGLLWYGLSLRWIALEWVDLDRSLALPWVSWAAVTALQAVVPAVALGLAGALRSRRVPLWGALALGLAVAEGLAPWVQPLPGGLALYLAPMQPLLWPAAWLGVPAFLLVVGAWAGAQARYPRWGIGILAVWFGVGLLPSPLPSDGEVVRVGLVQPNTGAFEARQPSTSQARRERLIALVRAASGAGADVVVTPEGAWPDVLDPRRPSTSRALRAAFSGVERVVLGATVGDQDPPSNSLLLLERGRLVARQDKVYLVPVTERAVLGLGRDRFTAGSQRTSMGPSSIGALVCYEDVVPASVRRLGGIGWLVSASNDAWLGRGPGSRQHEAGARLAAVRAGRWVVRPTTNGRSAVFDAAGRRHWHAPWIDGDATSTDTGLATVVTVRSAVPLWTGADVEPWLGLALCVWVGVLLVVRRPDDAYRGGVISGASRPDVSIEGSKG